MTNSRTRLKVMIGLLAVAVSASACAGTNPSNINRTSFVQMNDGRVSDLKFNAIKRRCANLGDRQFGSHVAGNMNFTIGNSGPAAFGQAFGNLMNFAIASDKQSGTFEECMARHGFYPKG